jgi:hypothetical protein
VSTGLPAVLDILQHLQKTPINVVRTNAYQLTEAMREGMVTPRRTPHVRILVMQVTIEIPEKLAVQLQTRWQDTLPHYVFERLVMEAYRDNMLTTRDVQDLLKLPDRLAVYDLCDKYKIATYTLADVQRDRTTTQRLGL